MLPGLFYNYIFPQQFFFWKRKKRRINLTEQSSDPSSDYSFSFGDYIFIKASLEYHEENGIGHKKRLLKQKNTKQEREEWKKRRVRGLWKPKRQDLHLLGQKDNFYIFFSFPNRAFFYCCSWLVRTVLAFLCVNRDLSAFLWLIQQPLAGREAAGAGRPAHPDLEGRSSPPHHSLGILTPSRCHSLQPPNPSKGECYTCSATILTGWDGVPHLVLPFQKGQSTNFLKPFSIVAVPAKDLEQREPEEVEEEEGKEEDDVVVEKQESLKPSKHSLSNAFRGIWHSLVRWPHLRVAKFTSFL